MVCGFLLLGIAWAGGDPIGAIPDEPAHFVKAYATVTGQFSGGPFSGNLNGLRPRSAAWFVAAGRTYLVPARLIAPSSVLCYAFDTARTADCQVFDPEPARPNDLVPASTHLGTYSPFPYLFTGPLMRGAQDFRSAVRRGRAASLFVCSVFIGLAAVLLSQRGPVALVSLGIAVTPAVVFLAASLNTSGIEITSAMCLWAALLGIVRGQSGRMHWMAGAVGGVVLALTRPLGAMMMPVILMTVVLLAGFLVPLRELRRHSPVAAISLLCVTLAAAMSFLWAEFGTPHPHVDLHLALASLPAAAADLPNQVRDVIGIFGFSNTTMPMAAYLLGLVLLGGLGLLALTLGTWRERSALVGLGLAITAVDLALAVLVEAQIGFGMQARYVLPLVVGLPLLAGDIVQSHLADLSEGFARRWLVATCSGVALLQLTAFVSNQHRYAVGLKGPWLGMWPGSWSPDGGLAVWLCIAVAGSISLVSIGWLLQRERSPQ